MRSPKPSVSVCAQLHYLALKNRCLVPQALRRVQDRPGTLSDVVEPLISSIILEALNLEQPDYKPLTASSWHADIMDFVLDNQRNWFPAWLSLPEGAGRALFLLDLLHPEADQPTNLACHFLLEHANQSGAAKHSPTAIVGRNTEGLSDMNMLLCSTLLVLKLIHILSSSSQHSSSVSAAKSALQDTLGLLNDDLAMCQSSAATPNPEALQKTAQLVQAVVQQSMMFVHVYMASCPDMAGVYLQTLTRVRVLADQGQATADEVVKQGKQ